MPDLACRGPATPPARGRDRLRERRRRRRRERGGERELCMVLEIIRHFRTMEHRRLREIEEESILNQRPKRVSL
ncbi:hypothetical protein EYF80_060998 [Liparis tanakae]|uniref:Uncharacterized protein n=1 Tax=Liparis tanakae TaxID=230148 RepID=A0A4Z2EJC2_9TELE|nr:hypothetical protein EYF80_060998 [Liparis tanakae]